MLKQASVRQFRSGELTRKDGYLVVTMCYYPRGLRKELRDEYSSRLAPDRILFHDFKKNQLAHGHEQGFVRSHYEERFRLLPEAVERLKELAALSRRKDVYLACQCEIGERCHREMLMLLAHEKFGAKIGKIYHRYPAFMARIKERRRAAPRLHAPEAGL